MGVQISYPRTDGERRVERDVNNLSDHISGLLSSGVWSIQDIGSLLTLIDKIGWDNLPEGLKRLLLNYWYGFKNATAIDNFLLEDSTIESSIDGQYSKSDIETYRQFEDKVVQHLEEAQESESNLSKPDELSSAVSNVQMTLQSNPPDQNASYLDKNGTEESQEEQVIVITQTADTNVDDSDVIQDKDLEGKSSGSDVPESTSILNGFDNPIPVTTDPSGRFNGAKNAGINTPKFEGWIERGGSVHYDGLTDTFIYGMRVEKSDGVSEFLEILYLPSSDPRLAGLRFPDFNRHSVERVEISGMMGVAETDITPPDVGDFSKAWDALEKQGVNVTETYGVSRRTRGDRVGTYPDNGVAGLTWHHTEDLKTLFLIDSNIHDMFKHKGGASISRMLND
jgi:hypothetical protein